MIFDISDEKRGTWFDMEDGGRVQLRSITAAEWRSIKKQTTRKKAEVRKIDGQLGRVEWDEINDDLRDELFWDAIIMDWENFFDRDKNPIPCTKENKSLLMTRSMKFAQFVNDGLKTIQEDETVRAEYAEKN